MIETQMPNGNKIYYSSGWIESIVYQYAEHYSKHTDKVFGINLCIDDIYKVREQHPDKKAVLVNLEHKAPIDQNGQLNHCSKMWTDAYNKMTTDTVHEVWDFQIENWEYYKFHGIENKFRFKPLRYTTWFDKYKKECDNVYELQMECAIDTNTRVKVINQLTTEPIADINGVWYTLKDYISLNLTNTNNSDLKFKAKNECKYGIDFPHYDTPCTINTTRIYEYICMNKPVIVWDRDHISSKKYFGELCTYLNDISAYDIKLLVLQEPRKDVDVIFKQMTYLEKDYDEYRLDILRDYKDRTGITVPDWVLS